ncbi:hypothetical protein [Actinoplanes sp. NPDC049118]|uniref:hypothetical protein n=1 Tax=Actinoplanes sp. NPDC049118 TaxID=3155769 RepID=UPI0033D9145D
MPAEAVRELLALLDADAGTAVLPAGCPTGIGHLFDLDPRLRPWFGATLTFPDPDAADLVEIAAATVTCAGYRMPDDVRDGLAGLLAERSADADFAHGRSAVGLVHDMVGRHARRVPDAAGVGLPLPSDLPPQAVPATALAAGPPAAERGEHR